MISWRHAVAVPLCWFVSGGGAAVLEKGFTEKVVAGSLVSPTALAIAPDGRVFIALQGGEIRIVKDDTLLSRPFASVMVNGTSQRGLLGIVLDPGFAENGNLYVYYTTSTPARNRLSRFTARGDVASPSGEAILFELPPRSDGLATDHMGGGLAFGSDGKLYVGVGDHQAPLAQDVNAPYGKILRVNADGTFPADNPFSGADTGWARAVWTLGMRNPFGLAADARTGALFAADVGESLWEEVNDIRAGVNYGWNLTEGISTDPGIRSPVYAYGHAGLEACSIIGGAFVSPGSAGAEGTRASPYLFADFCGGWIRRYDADAGTFSTFATGILWPVAVQVSPQGGSVYYIERGYSYGTSDPAVSSVFKVSPEAAQPVHAQAGRERGKLLVALRGNRVIVPSGATRVRVHDLSGRTLWQARGLIPGSDLALPANFSRGVARILWE